MKSKIFLMVCGWILITSCQKLKKESKVLKSSGPTIRPTPLTKSARELSPPSDGTHSMRTFTFGGNQLEVGTSCGWMVSDAKMFLQEKSYFQGFRLAKA